MVTPESAKRQSVRIYSRIPVICEIKMGDTTRSKTAIARNISTEGFCLEIEEILPVDTELNIRFQLPGTSQIVAACGKVVWIESVKDEKYFTTGVIFINLPEEEKLKITQLIERLNINKILDVAINRDASDLHLVVGQPPVLRIQGDLQTLDLPALTPDDITNLVYALMSEEQIFRFKQDKELDFGFQYDLNNRFRVNLHQQRGFFEATLRLISTKVFSFEELKIPEIVKDFARQKDGLILIVGPTGSGKTTTIAAMVELVNQERKAVIITLERPIEYVHNNNKCIIKQREVGVDTSSFSLALKTSLRQDPNVIVVGELEDIETVKTALIAAEAGYLVIASFHAPNTIQAVDRLASIFPVENRKQILAQLANCLRGIVFQLLIPRKDKKERLLATEVVVANDAVKGVIRKDELIQLPTIIQTSGGYKMQSLYDSVKKYLNDGLIDPDTAMIYSEGFSHHGPWTR